MADVLKVGADKTEGLVFASLFELINPFDGSLVQYIAPDTVIRIGGIGNNSPLSEDFRNLPDQSFLGILGVYLKQHDLLWRPSSLRFCVILG